MKDLGRDGRLCTPRRDDDGIKLKVPRKTFNVPRPVGRDRVLHVLIAIYQAFLASIPAVCISFDPIYTLTDSSCSIQSQDTLALQSQRQSAELRVRAGQKNSGPVHAFVRRTNREPTSSPYSWQAFQIFSYMPQSAICSLVGTRN